MCASVSYRRAKGIANAFSLVTAILTLDAGGHILGVVAEELAEDAIFESGAAVMPVIGWSKYAVVLDHQLQAIRLALWLTVLQPGLMGTAFERLEVEQQAIAADFRPARV